MSSTTSVRTDTAAPPSTGPSDRRPLLALTGLLATVVVLLGVEGSGAAPDGTVVRGAAAWAVAAALVLAGVGLLVLGRRGSSRQYASVAQRDLRLDLLLGLAVVFVVVDQVELASVFELVTQETVGIVSGVELFVALSGVVLGLAYRQRFERSDVVEVTGVVLRRAWRSYCLVVVVVLGVYLLTLVPGVDGRVVTTFELAEGQVSDTYPNAERFGDYPVPGFLVRDLLLLRLGPSQLNLVGLHVVLLAVTPLLLAALARRLVLVLLVLSWAAYALDSRSGVRLFDAQFEEPFPLLTWQVLFVTGLAVGWYRETLLAWSRTPAGRAALVVAVLLHLGVVVLAASSSFLANGYDVRLDLLAPASFDAVYGDWFTRRPLGLGRLLGVWLLLATAYAALTAFWSPVDRAVGWLLVPLGRAWLTVLVLHVVAALLVANVPGLRADSVAWGTLGHGLVLGALWVLVTHRSRLSHRSSLPSRSGGP